MVIKQLIKSKSFILGFVVGGILTFGSSFVPIIGNLIEYIFDYINSISPLSKMGVWGSVVHSYLLSLIFYFIIYYLINKRVSLVGFKRFSLGFLSVYLLYLILALIATSQFKFTQ